MTVDVVIAGAGPNGLLLAAELCRAGVRPVVLDRLPAPSDEPKANGLVGQVVQLLDRHGLYEALSGSVDRPRANGVAFMFAGLPLDLSMLDESPVYTLPVPQSRIVAVLEQHAVGAGVEIRRGHELVGLAQDADGVTIDVSGPDGSYQLRAKYLVGADGAHSTTRKLCGIDFPGVSYDRRTARSANATVPAEWIDPTSGALEVPGYGTVRPFLPERTSRGGFSYAPLPGKPPLVSTLEWDQPETDGPMTLAELRESACRVLGVDIPLGAPDGEGPHAVRRLVGGNTRIAERFRAGRVLLVGDAAHVYSGIGAPGLNLGLQDAANLGWKLAAEVLGTAPLGLLDSYQAERLPAARRTVMYAQAQCALIGPGDDVTSLRELFGELLADHGTVQRLADLTAGSDVRYDMGEGAGHPLAGRFAPDLALRTVDGETRLAELARSGRPLLLDLTTGGSLAETVGDRVEVVTARPAGDEAPGIGALLVRPDSYVAWATASTEPDTADIDGLRDAVDRWFGGVPAII